MAEMSMLLAVTYRPETALPAWWLVLSFCFVLALMTTVSILVGAAKGRTTPVYLAVAVILIAFAPIVYASYAPWPDWCNPDWIPYMICWPW